MKNRKFMMVAAVCLMFLQVAGYGEVVLPPVLSSHMVLQRGMKVPVWGTATPGEKVTVKFRDQEKSTTADAQGKWMVKLDSMVASAEPGTMVVAGTTEKKELVDVLVGDVWLGAGQSNMWWPCSAGWAKKDPVLAKNFASGPYPQLRVILPEKTWLATVPANFSALLFSFALPVQKELNIPIGLMLGAVSGTPSGYWLSEEAYNSDPACKEVIAKFAKTYNYDEAVKRYVVAMEKWKKACEKARAEGVEEKKFPKAPMAAQKAGECTGVVGNLYEKHIRPYIPYAIRGVVWDQGESGTAIKGLDQYTLMGALINGWRKEWGQTFSFIYVQKPSGGGCAWDTADPVTSQSDPLTPLPDKVPSGGEDRETHIKIMNYPDTFMATSSDLESGLHPVNKSGYGARVARVALGGVYGKEVEIYGPIYKSHKIDGNKVIVSFNHVGKGLVFKKAESVDKLQGFTLSGDGKTFVWADAVIDGKNVVVSSDKVSKPVAVRYAWAGVHPWTNLFNNDGLPALPFRTDF